MSGAAFNRGESRQDWETPAELIRAVEKRFGNIKCDLAASFENTKASWYFSQANNSLADSAEWPTCQLCWLNPPFGKMAPWVEKCARTADRGGRILLLAPAAVGSRWFDRFVHRKAFVLALSRRVKFVGAKDVYPKDLILAAYGFGLGFDTWDWGAK